MLDIMQPGIPTVTALPIFAATGSHESFIKRFPLTDLLLNPFTVNLDLFTFFFTVI